MDFQQKSFQTEIQKLPINSDRPNCLLGTRLALSTACSPQMDVQTERLNTTLEQYIRVYNDIQFT